MTTTWIAGRSSKRRPGGVTRPGPPNDTGLARGDQCGSVRTLTPSSWTSSVECPTRVTAAGARHTDERQRDEGETEQPQDQLVVFPTGSSTMKAAPPPGRFSPHRRPECSEMMP